MSQERMPASHGGATSHGHLLELIRSTGGLSRQQLLAATGMSRATLYERLETLLRRGFIYEAESLQATGGRRSRKIRFDDRGRVVLAIALGQTHATVSVTDTRGTPLRSVTTSQEISGPADSVLSPLIQAGKSLLSQGFDEVLTGVGVSLPTPVEAGTGFVAHATTIPGWPPDAVARAVKDAWDVPFVVENDARAAALGERTSDAETIVYVKVATGIGCGIVVEGSILRGARGAAGDIGHIRMAEDGPVCRCGRQGCLAAYSSGRAISDRLSDQGITYLQAVSDAARAGDPRVAPIIGSAAAVLGRALSATITTLNPDRLVLGGIIGTIPGFVDQVRATVMAIVVERIADGLTIEAGDPGDQSASQGLATLVMRKVFSPEAINAAVNDFAIA
ncbi:ROK family transcriptional regulator [Arthrobacter pascens]|uniref:ROK family transcriptional regulator n=1 Tax=Arthrobacter pascens TaxID=1677 RepID=UPI00196A378C|nr:ROK family transcriptional regulator [Arthrobacter pascens]MBN3499830.1 ROK family transcriptional regulator [Arthrobacter pascens]MDR6557653.1 putative NBD/HSP70 family sugar kinase [Arthrobacter pascens]